jgi:16S rRNA (uracil1498-N3)-methyltransferase
LTITSKSPPWFFLDQVVSTAMTVTLPLEEARHAAGSRRLEEGAYLILFNGDGLVSEARVTSVADRGRSVELEIVSTRLAEATPFALHLASALPKGDRLSVLLDMATQLGITSFTPLHCERSVVKTGENAERRWRRILVEACKQSRQAYVPKLNPAQTPAEISSNTTGAMWAAHPGGTVPDALSLASDDSVTVLVGPEGGFGDNEMAAMTSNGVKLVSLGNAILRTETAATALVSYARLRYGIDKQC